MLLFYSMSWFHVAVAVAVGVLVGGVIGLMYETMNLKKGAFVLRFVLLGVIGSLGLDLFFSFMTANHFFPAFLYLRPVIVAEEALGAALVPYLIYRPFIEYKPPRLRKKT